MEELLQYLGTFLQSLLGGMTASGFFKPSASAQVQPAAPPATAAPTASSASNTSDVLTPTPSSAEPPLLVALQRLILIENFAIGPMPGTGGIVHAVSSNTAAQVAALILENAATFAGLSLAEATALISAWLCGESRFDPQALNPNDQDAKPAETPAQAFGHADVGIAQFDGATLEGMPALAGLSVAAIEAKAFDPAWAIPQFVGFISSLWTWAQRAFAADTSLASRVPNGDFRVLAAQAYNQGPTGAKKTAYTQGAEPSAWAYGLGVISRFEKFQAQLATLATP